MKRELLRIEPWSAVRVGFFFGLLIGFAAALFEVFLLKSLSGTSAKSLLPPEASQMVGMSGGAIAAMAVIMALFFSLLIAFLSGLGAIFYNAITRWFGGIEFALSGDDDAAMDRDDDDARRREDDADV
jgi:hypothetical protein